MKVLFGFHLKKDKMIYLICFKYGLFYGSKTPGPRHDWSRLGILFPTLLYVKSCEESWGITNYSRRLLLMFHNNSQPKKKLCCSIGIIHFEFDPFSQPFLTIYQLQTVVQTVFWSFNWDSSWLGWSVTNVISCQSATAWGRVKNKIM